MSDTEIIQALEADIRRWWASALLTEELIVRLQHAARDLADNDG